MKDPARIGFLASQFDEAYQNAVWSGAVAEAKASGVSLVFYVTTGTGMTAFDLAGKNDLSGLIVMTNAMGPSLSHLGIAKQLARFAGIPLISIGTDFPGVPGICPDNSGCVRALTEHLVAAHGRKKFLFLAGPPAHQEGMLRQSEFLETHERLLPLADKPRVECCDFDEETAYRKTGALVSGGFGFDAVMAANDRMALGAIRALEEHGISVPGDVSVTGYDNIDESCHSIPPLTTVGQPMGELGACAVRYIAARIQAAGLSAAPLDSDSGSPAMSGPVSEECGPSRLRSAPVMRASCGCTGGSGAENRHPSRTTERQTENRLRYQLARRVLAEERFASLRKFGSSLTIALGMDELLAEVANIIAAQGIGFAALVLFESAQGVSGWSKLMMISGPGGTNILAPHGLRFRTMEILPGGLPPEQRAFVCEQLAFAPDRLGYLVCSTDARDGHIYPVLREQVSAAIKRTLLLEEERNREKALEREVRRRTKELSLANRRLTGEIARRTELERELLDISNNIMTRIGQDIHDDLCQDIAGIGVLGAMLSSALRKEAHPQAELAARITETASRTVKHAKDIARDLYPAEFSSNGIISAVAQLVDARRRDSGAAIELAVADGFFVDDPAKALQLYRIIQEALGNAVRHSGAGHIRVALSMAGNAPGVEVSDDGRGMKERSPGENGMGLKILRYRANVIGGALEIRSDAGGTAVACRLSR